MIIIDKKRKIGVYLNPKHPKVHYSFYLNNHKDIEDMNPSAFKRFNIIQSILKN